MLSERHAGSRIARRDIFFEAAETSECRAQAHAVRLITLRITDGGGNRGNLAGSVQRNKHHTVIVAEHEIVGGYHMRAARCGAERIGSLPLQPLRSDRQLAKAEDG